MQKVLGVRYPPPPPSEVERGLGFTVQGLGSFPFASELAEGA